jgi:hypothetical protein
MIYTNDIVSNNNTNLLIKAINENDEEIVNQFIDEYVLNLKQLIIFLKSIKYLFLIQYKINIENYFYIYFFLTILI